MAPKTSSSDPAPPAAPEGALRIAEVEAERFAYGGECVTRLPDGKLCFVRGGIPGERLRITVTAEKPRFARGRLLEVLRPAPGRRIPACPRFGVCPGCSYLHIGYPEEVAAKARQFADFLLRGQLAAPEALQPPFPAPRRFGCRNKLTPTVVAAGEGKTAAFRADDNVTPVPLPPEGCRLADDALNALLPAAVDAAAAGETLLLRRDGAGGAFAADLPGWPETLEEEVGGVRFEVPAAGFFQTDPEVAEELAARVADAVAETAPGEVLELYCGVGVFSVVAARRLPECRFTGVEIGQEAIRCAAANAERAGVAARCRFFAADAERARIPRDAELVIVDPPRRGLAEALCRRLNASRARRLVYVSCAPDTLRRDLERLAAGKWRVTEAGVLDMFPGTAHFESLTILDR